MTWRKGARNARRPFTQPKSWNALTRWYEREVVIYKASTCNCSLLHIDSFICKFSDKSHRCTALIGVNGSVMTSPGVPVHTCVVRRFVTVYNADMRTTVNRHYKIAPVLHYYRSAWSEIALMYLILAHINKIPTSCFRLNVFRLKKLNL